MTKRKGGGASGTTHGKVLLHPTGRPVTRRVACLVGALLFSGCASAPTGACIEVYGADEVVIGSTYLSLGCPIEIQGTKNIMIQGDRLSK